MVSYKYTDQLAAMKPLYRNEKLFCNKPLYKREYANKLTD